MTRTVTIVTPDNVAVTYQLAGFVSRFIAFAVDLAIQFVVLLLIDSVIAAGSGLFARVGLSFGSILEAGGILAAFGVVFGYATLFEMIWGGRTPGKRLLGMRVVRDGGLPIDLISSALRNVMRFVDFGILPLSGTPIVLYGLPGILSIMCSGEYKRLGDYAAGTIVIIEARTPEILPEADQHPPAFMGPVEGRIPQLSHTDFRLVRQFLARAADIEPRVRALLTDRLFARVCRSLKMTVPAANTEQKLATLRYIERIYSNRAGLL